MKEKFKILKSTCVPLNIENVDTDQIIPARFLKATSKEGFGDNLFYDWRYAENEELNPNFVLNDSDFSGEILVAGKNFGSGSSREHAAWAVRGYGFKVVISSFFADIFKNNALNNFLLPLVVSEKFLESIFRSIEDDKQMELIVDLEAQTVMNIASGESESFEINAYKKSCLLNAYDDIDYLLSKKNDIIEWENSKN